MRCAKRTVRCPVCGALVTYGISYRHALLYYRPGVMTRVAVEKLRTIHDHYYVPAGTIRCLPNHQSGPLFTSGAVHCAGSRHVMCREALPVLDTIDRIEEDFLCCDSGVL